MQNKLESNSDTRSLSFPLNEVRLLNREEKPKSNLF